MTLALWFSAAAAVLCVGMVLRRPRPKAMVAPTSPTLVGSGAPMIPLSSSTTVLASGGLGALGWLVANPAVGVVVAALALVHARAGARLWVARIAAPAAMATAAAYVVTTVVRHDIAPGLEWADEVGRAHPVAWLAVLALVADVAVSSLRRRERR